MRRKAGPVEQLVRLDVVRHCCRARPKQQGRNDADGEGTSDDVDQVQDAGTPCQLHQATRWRRAGLAGFNATGRRFRSDHDVALLLLDGVIGTMTVWEVRFDLESTRLRGRAA